MAAPSTRPWRYWDRRPPAVGGVELDHPARVRGAQVTSVGQSNGDWGVLHLKSEITSTSGQFSTIAVDTGLSQVRGVINGDLGIASPGAATCARTPSAWASAGTGRSPST